MNMWLLTFQVVLFGLLTWLGLYLVVRAPHRPLLWFTATAILAFAGAVAWHTLSELAFTIRLAFQLVQVERFFIFLSAFFGLAAIVTLAPRYAAWVQRWERQKRPMIAAWFGLTGFFLGAAFLVFSGSFVPQTLLLAVMGASLWMLGTAVTVIHASDQGEAWLPHFLRSFDYAFFTAVLFGGQVMLVMVYALGVSFPMLLLLLGTVTAAIAVQVFSDPVQSVLDRIAFFNSAAIRLKRSNLRAESSAVQLTDTTLDVLGMDEAIFTRHTRRALSHLEDLPKLAASPLTQLPLVQLRLEQNGRTDSTLLRAQELKQILIESIERLKPPGEADFGTSDAWRHYNALYFPYVLGLRPYSRRYFYEPNGEGKTAAADALAWFRAQVPERTLHNWQNTAAQLVARDLRERAIQ